MRLLAALLLLLCSAARADGSTPLKVTARSFAQVRETFNAADAGPRALVFLSSDCAACIPAAEALQAMVAQQAGPLTVFVVWDEVLAKHPPPPSERVTRLLTDARIHQLWDPEHRLSTALRQLKAGSGAHLPQARLRTKRSEGGVLYDAVVLFPPGARWTKELPTPDFFDGGFEAVKPELRRRLRELTPAPARATP